MDNGDVLVPDVVNHDLADIRLRDQVTIPYAQQAVSLAYLVLFRGEAVRGAVGQLGRSRTEEQKVAALERRFHGPGQDDDDGRGRVGDNGEAGRGVCQHVVADIWGDLGVLPFPHHESRGENQAWYRRMSVSRHAAGLASGSAIPKLRTWAASCRGFPRTESMTLLLSVEFSFLLEVLSHSIGVAGCRSSKIAGTRALMIVCTCSPRKLRGGLWGASQAVLKPGTYLAAGGGPGFVGILLGSSKCLGS